jgi:cytochrome P450
LRRGCEVLAMGVLSKAAFGGSGQEKGDGEELEMVREGHQLSYLECIKIIMPNLMGVILVGGLKVPVPNWLFPSGLRKVKLAVEEYKVYLAELVQREQKKGLTEQGGVPNLATLMVRANDIEKDEILASGAMTGYLSDEELFGNMFAFNMAGYETTAMTLSFCLPHLALYPEVQVWAREEVDTVFGHGKELVYEEAYENLPRVRALMYETLRLHSPVAHLPRLSPPEMTALEVPSMNMTISVPPDSLVSTPIAIAGYIPNKFNGLDPYIFDPKRFITRDKTGKELLIDDNELLKHGYMPFTIGPRQCPGKKFSQVEFTRILCTLLSKTEIRPAGGRVADGQKMAEERLKAALRNTFFNLTLSIRNADQYAIEFVPRWGE